MARLRPPLLAMITMMKVPEYERLCIFLIVCLASNVSICVCGSIEQVGLLKKRVRDDTKTLRLPVPKSSERNSRGRMMLCISPIRLVTLKWKPSRINKMETIICQ